MKKLLSLLFICFLISCSTDSDATNTVPEVDNPDETGQDVTDYVDYYDGRIVFNFAENYTVGQFANGDYWVHNNGDNVVITEIVPASRKDETGRVIHGTMVNPAVSGTQGYDSEPRDMNYDNALNVDPGNTTEALTAAPGSSVIKSISKENNDGRPMISDAAILTVLAKKPDKGSFRPGYVGTDKSSIATIDDLDYSLLGKHAPIGGEADLDEVAKKYERVWLEHNTEWTARDIHPENHMPDYGRDITTALAEGLLLLQMDYSNEQKEKLLINMVQYGLDVYNVAKNGGEWYNNGGHNLGRKMPLVLAATVLGNSEMLAYADKEKHFIFQDDQNHFYIGQEDVDITHSPSWNPDDRATPIPYETSDIGRAEWGIRAADQPQKNNKSMDATYRNVCGPGQTQHILAARMMGVEAVWNWNPVFDYADFYYEASPDRFDNYFKALWQAYR
ncbi:hypothetical protein ACWGOQ_0009355 [Aquimarina sp. M1]